MPRRPALDAQHATTRTRSRAPRRHGFQITDNRLFSASLDEFLSGDHERREAALKVTDMAVGQHLCELDPGNDVTVCTHPDHERDADWARVALDVLGLDDLAADDEADLDLVPEPAPERARLSRSSFTRPEWGWQDAASCRGEDLVLFFGPDGERQPEREIREREAKQICMGCLVRTDCLDYAVSRPEKYGVYGGLNEEERRLLHRARMARERKARKDTAA